MKLTWTWFAILLLQACNGANESKEPADVENRSTIEDQLKASVKQFPDSLLLKENLIQYYRENGNYDGALHEVNRALQSDSANARLWDIKAILHSENEDTAAAINAFEKAVDIVAEPADIISLATLYAQTKNSKALELADALLLADRAKADKEAVFIKGLYFSSTGQKEKAIRFFDECLSMDYTFMYAYREKCLALYDLGKFQPALDVINKALTLQNGYEEGYYYQGKCLERLNRPAEAIEAYQTALMYAPDYIEAKEALARLGVKT